MTTPGGASPDEEGARELRAAERTVVRTLTRLHREQPLEAGFRIDAVLARAAASPADTRPRSHRGAGAATDDPELLAHAVTALVERGDVERDGRRIRLAGASPRLGADMRARADALIERLRAAAPRVPPTDTLARDLGLPAAVLDYLRRDGEIVSIGPRIDYPSDVLDGLLERAAGARDAEGGLSVARLRDLLGTGRRHAHALLEHLESASSDTD